MPTIETILNLGLGALTLALIGYGMSSMGPTQFDYQIAKACYSSATLLIIILAEVWLISSKWSMGIRIVMAFVILGVIGAGWGILVGIAQNREETQNQIEAKKAYTGSLKPEKNIIFSGKDNIYPDIELGDSTTIIRYIGPKGGPLFAIADDNDLIIEFDNQGHIRLSVKIRDKNGQLIAELTRNEWKVNPQNAWDRNFSNNALEVRDPTGDVVLQVKIIDNRIQFQGEFYGSSGKGIVIGSFGKGQGGFMQPIGPQTPPKLIKKIKPLFKYPSELHLGEFVENH